MPRTVHNQRILLIRLSALGDVIHGLPAAAAIKEALPQVNLTWVVEPPFAELLSNNPAVDEVIVFPKKALKASMKEANLAEFQSQFSQFLSALRRNQFDAAIDLQGLFKSAAIAFLSGAPIRVGFGQARELAPLLYTHRLHADYFGFDTHVVDHNVALAEFLLKIVAGRDPKSGEVRDFPLPPVAPEVVERLCNTIGGVAPAAEPASMSLPDPITAYLDRAFSENFGVEQEQIAEGSERLSISRVGASPSVEPAIEGDSDTRGGDKAETVDPAPSTRPIVAFIPGTTWTSKIWPKEKWAELADQILHVRDVRIVIVGGPSETDVNSWIQKQIEHNNPEASCIDLTGKTSLLDLVALYRFVHLAIGVDTGPLHLASAAGVSNVVGVFGSTPTGRNGPYGPRGPARTVTLELSCQPCFKKTCPLSTRACLVDLNSEAVLNAIRDSLRVTY